MVGFKPSAGSDLTLGQGEFSIMLLIWNHVSWYPPLTLCSLTLGHVRSRYVWMLVVTIGTSFFHLDFHHSQKLHDIFDDNQFGIIHELLFSVHPLAAKKYSAAHMHLAVWKMRRCSVTRHLTTKRWVGVQGLVVMCRSSIWRLLVCVLRMPFVRVLGCTAYNTFVEQRFDKITAYNFQAVSWPDREQKHC